MKTTGLVCKFEPSKVQELDIISELGESLSQVQQAHTQKTARLASMVVIATVSLSASTLTILRWGFE